MSTTETVVEPRGGPTPGACSCVAKPVLFKALAAAQAEFPVVEFDATGKVKGETKSGQRYEYEYQYATLANIISSIRPALNKHGLFLTQDVWTADDGVAHCIKTRLMHESGQVLESGVMLARPIAGGMQAIGGVIAYAKRYQLTAFLGLAVGEIEDDDGAADQREVDRSKERVSMPRAKQEAKPENKPASPEVDRETGEIHEPKKDGDVLLQEGAKKVLRQAIARSGITEEDFYQRFSHTVDTLPFANMNDVMKELRGIMA